MPSKFAGVIAHRPLAECDLVTLTSPSDVCIAQQLTAPLVFEPLPTAQPARTAEILGATIRKRVHASRERPGHAYRQHVPGVDYQPWRQTYLVGPDVHHGATVLRWQAGSGSSVHVEEIFS